MWNWCRSLSDCLGLAAGFSVERSVRISLVYGLYLREFRTLFTED